MKRRNFPYRIVVILFIAAFFVLVATGNQRESIITYNVNSVKSLEAVHIVNKYTTPTQELIVPWYDSFQEAIKVAPTSPVAFQGSMTGYGPDCEGCGGFSGCPPRQDFRNGNIYFEDATYGTVRVVASDKAIPCGSMVRVKNYGEPFLAIVLDRGGAIKGSLMDLLCASEKEALAVGRRKNIQYELIRWGW